MNAPVLDLTPPAGYRTDIPVDALCNTPDDVLFGNIDINIRRDLLTLGEAPVHDGVAVLVGGGPSLVADIEQIRARAASGQVIFALNNTALYLREHGIEADWLVVIDCRPENLRFLEGFPAKNYMLSPQCDPVLFNHLVRQNVVTLLPSIEGMRERLPKDFHRCIMIGGGITVGLTAMAAAFTMGFRDLHLFGYDSSDADDGEAHAYPQSQTGPEQKRLEAWFHGRKFRCSFAMYAQADKFPGFAHLLAEEGAAISVHGDGLLPSIAREMAKPLDPSRAVYDLSRCPASYDFVDWLVQAEMVRRQAGADGPLRVTFAPGPSGGFRDDGLPVDLSSRQQFLDMVMRPALELVGAVEEPVISPMACWHPTYTLKPVVEMVKAGASVPKLRAPDHAIAEVVGWLFDHDIRKAPITITLRESEHWPQRNSRVLNWMRLANHLKALGESVVFVRDTAKVDEIMSWPYCSYPLAATDVLVRAALYSQAKCNLFTSNGPAALALFSDVPFLIFEPLKVADYVPSSDEWFLANHGIARGTQYPWLRPDQRIIWEADSYPAIREAWDELAPMLNH